MKLCIKGGYVVGEDFEGVADIGIDSDGRIAAIGTSAFDADEVIDAEGALVMPGCVDIHTHLRSPGYPEREGLESGTLAALVGGVTSLIEMPMADRGTCTAERVLARETLFAAGSYVDFGFFGAGGSGALPAIQEMADVGVLGFKTFMRPAYPNRDESFEGTTVESEADLARVATAIAMTGRPWLVHAENVYLKAAAHRAESPAGQDKLKADRWAEVEAVRAAIAHARASGVKLHVVHVTTRDALEEIVRAQIDLDITCEVCIPHLALIAGDEDRYGPLARVSPSAKDERDRAALWRGVEAGFVTAIASDHASFAPTEFEEVLSGRVPGPLGIPSLEHLVPLALTIADQRSVSLRATVAALTARPARRFGLWPRKGSLTIGADADLVVMDKSSTTIRQGEMTSKGKYTPFDGWELRYGVRDVITSGRVAVQDGQVAAKPGWGSMLRPIPSQ